MRMLLSGFHYLPFRTMQTPHNEGAHRAFVNFNKSLCNLYSNKNSSFFLCVASRQKIRPIHVRHKCEFDGTSTQTHTHTEKSERQQWHVKPPSPSAPTPSNAASALCETCVPVTGCALRWHTVSSCVWVCILLFPRWLAGTGGKSLNFTYIPAKLRCAFRDDDRAENGGCMRAHNAGDRKYICQNGKRSEYRIAIGN